jgi:hypothetical protein
LAGCTAVPEYHFAALLAPNNSAWIRPDNPAPEWQLMHWVFCGVWKEARSVGWASVERWKKVDSG